MPDLRPLKHGDIGALNAPAPSSSAARATPCRRRRRAIEEKLIVMCAAYGEKKSCWPRRWPSACSPRAKSTYLARPRESWRKSARCGMASCRGSNKLALERALRYMYFS